MEKGEALLHRLRSIFPYFIKDLQRLNSSNRIRRKLRLRVLQKIFKTYELLLNAREKRCTNKSRGRSLFSCIISQSAMKRILLKDLNCYWVKKDKNGSKLMYSWQGSSHRPFWYTVITTGSEGSEKKNISESYKGQVFNHLLHLQVLHAVGWGTT